MKKFLVAILAILYLSTSMGTTIHIHYCMGRLVDWGLIHHNDSKCSKCGMKRNPKSVNGCCKDEHKLIKVDQDQKPSENFIGSNEAACQMVPVILSGHSNSIIFFLFAKLPKTDPPPRSCHTSLNIINCVLLI